MSLHNFLAMLAIVLLVVGTFVGPLPFPPGGPLRFSFVAAGLATLAAVLLAVP